jgi:hypothetical protein
MVDDGNHNISTLTLMSNILRELLVLSAEQIPVEAPTTLVRFYPHQTARSVQQ